MAKVFYLDELFGRTVTKKEWAALTADQLRDAITSYDLVAVKCPNGRCELIDPGSYDYCIEMGRWGFFRPSEHTKDFKTSMERVEKTLTACLEE